MDTARHLVLADVVGDLRSHADDALALADVAVLQPPVDLADQGGRLRRPGLEELDDARQASGDVLGLGGLPRNLGEHVARTDGVTLLDLEMGAGRHQVGPGAFTRSALNLDPRLEPVVRGLDDHRL